MIEDLSGKNLLAIPKSSIMGSVFNLWCRAWQMNLKCGMIWKGAYFHFFGVNLEISTFPNHFFNNKIYPLL